MHADILWYIINRCIGKSMVPLTCEHICSSRRESAAMKGAQLVSAEISVPNLRAYKVLGDDMTLESMQHHAWESDDLDGRDSIQDPEWQALYMQFKRSHVLGTVPYRWESKAKAYTHAQLVEVLFDSIEIVVLDGAVLHDASVGGDTKATLVKTHLRLGNSCCEDDDDKTGRLMHELGKSGKAALVRETEDEWELLIPHCLLPRLRFSEKVIARWRRHPTLPIASHWCDATEQMWYAWDDSLQMPNVPDLELPDFEGLWDASADQSTNLFAGRQVSGSVTD